MLSFFKKKKAQTATPLIDDEVIFSVMRGGARVMPAWSANTVIAKNHQLLFTLRLSLDLSPFLQHELVDPLILRTAKMCSSLPASQGAHDPDAGGLFRHSVLVAINALSALNHGESTPSDKLKLSVLIASLEHDLLKVWCDVEICDHASASTIWDPFLSTLDDFIIKHNCKQLELHYRPGRANDHDASPELRALLFFGGNFRVLAYLKQNIELASLLNGTHPVWELVNGADILSARMSGSSGSSVMHLPDFINAQMYERIVKEPLSVNHQNADLFVMPGGVIVTFGSSEWEKLALLSRGLFAKEHGQSQGGFVSSLKNTGVIKLFGATRIFAWYRIECQKAIIYVRGLMLRLNTDELLDKVPKADVIERGCFPPELAERSDLKDKNRLVIKASQTLCSSDAVEDALKVSSVDPAHEALSKHSALLSPTEKEGSCLKLVSKIPSASDLSELLRRRRKLKRDLNDHP